MKIPWRGAVGLALTVLLLWWVFHDVPWAEVQAHTRRLVAAPISLRVSVASSCQRRVGHGLLAPLGALRGIRWRLI